jgi:hypothetical protein
MIRRFFTYLQFAPLIAFSLYARWYGLSSQSWKGAFILGGAIALVQVLFLLYEKIELNRFILGANLFLFVGGLAFLANISWLLEVYAQIKEAALFANLFLVGCVTSFTPSGFIGVVHKNKRRVRLFSFYLLLSVIGAFCVSLYFKGDINKAGVVPFLLLILFQRYLATEIGK